MYPDIKAAFNEYVSVNVVEMAHDKTPVLEVLDTVVL